MMINNLKGLRVKFQKRRKKGRIMKISKMMRFVKR